MNAQRASTTRSAQHLTRRPRLALMAMAVAAALHAPALQAAQASAAPAQEPAAASGSAVPAPAPAPAPAAPAKAPAPRWWDKPLADRLNAALDNFFSGLRVAPKDGKPEGPPWWEVPLADSLNRGLDRAQARAAQLRWHHVSDLASDLGVAGPVLMPNPVLAAPKGEVDRSQALTLLQAWQAARLNDPQLRAARAGSAAAQERLPQARAQALPAVGYSASEIRNNVTREGVNTLNQPLEIFDRYESRNQTLSFRQPLFRIPLIYAVSQARLVGEEAQANLERETQNLAARVSGFYFEALLARDQLALVLTQQAFLRTVLEAEKRAVAAGTGTRTAVDEAQAKLDLNQAQELEARQAVEYTRRQLQNLINRPIGDLAKLDSARLKAELLAPNGLEDWVSRALVASPEVRALNAQLGQAKEEVNKARTSHLPTLDLVAQAQRSRSENIIAPSSSYVNRSIGVQLNVPLYNGGQVNSATRQASAERERVSEQLEALKLDLSLRIHREYRGVTDGLARVRGLEQAARSAEVALDSARKSLTAGVRSLVDVLNAEQNRVLVQRDLAQARYAVLVAAVRLHALSGAANEEVMALVSASLVP